MTRVWLRLAAATALSLGLLALGRHLSKEP